MILADQSTNPELISYLAEIAKHAAEVTYYLAAGTRAYYEVITFLNSAKALLIGAAGFGIGLLFGRRQ